jgi:hypothetical protein
MSLVFLSRDYGFKYIKQNGISLSLDNPSTQLEKLVKDNPLQSKGS